MLTIDKNMIPGDIQDGDFINFYCGRLDIV